MPTEKHTDPLDPRSDVATRVREAAQELAEAELMLERHDQALVRCRLVNEVVDAHRLELLSEFPELARHVRDEGGRLLRDQVQHLRSKLGRILTGASEDDA